MHRKDERHSIRRAVLRAPEGDKSYWINASEFRANLETDFSSSVRLWARLEQKSVMLTTLLVIILCMAAGTFVSQAHFGRGKR